MADRVQVLKQEWPTLGGSETDFEPSPIEPNEDGLEARAYYVQKDTGRDSAVGTTRDTSDNLVLFDPIAGSKTLSQLLSSSGLPSLDFLLTCDPVADDTTYSITFGSSSRVDAETWKTTADNKNIKTVTYTYTGGKVASVVVRVFAADGVTIAAQTTETYSYSGSRVTGSTLTRDI